MINLVFVKNSVLIISQCCQILNYKKLRFTIEKWFLCRSNAVNSFPGLMAFSIFKHFEPIRVNKHALKTQYLYIYY